MRFRRRRSLLKRVALGFAVAAIAAPVAAAVPTQDTSLGSTSPEAAYLEALQTRSEALNAAYGLGTPDALDRFIANNPDGTVNPLSVETPVAVTRPAPGSRVSAIGGTPETIVGGVADPAPTPISQPSMTPASGFDFGDAGVGFGLAAVLALLAAGAALGARQRGKLATGH